MKPGYCLEVGGKLRAGTEIERLAKASQYTKFGERVLQRMEQLTNKYLSLVILESMQDGSSKKTKEFKDIWERREEHVSTVCGTPHDPQQL